MQLVTFGWSYGFVNMVIVRRNWCGRVESVYRLILTIDMCFKHNPKVTISMGCAKFRRLAFVKIQDGHQKLELVWKWSNVHQIPLVTMFSCYALNTVLLEIVIFIRALSKLVKSLQFDLIRKRLWTRIFPLLRMYCPVKAIYWR